MRRLLPFFAVLLAFGTQACCSAQGGLRGGVRPEQVVAQAKRQIGVKYRFGGGSPSEGFDCSGLVGYCYAQLGVQLPRTTAALYMEGRKVGRDSLQLGDLLFFDTNGGGPTHVGIYSRRNHMIHAPSSGGRVREEDLAIPYWVDHFVGARRLE